MTLFCFRMCSCVCAYWTLQGGHLECASNEANVGLRACHVDGPLIMLFNLNIVTSLNVSPPTSITTQIPLECDASYLSC